MNCRIVNYGVGGYGTDQTLLKLKQLIRADPSPTIFFDVMPENIIRNLNQYRQLIAGRPQFSLKPRYKLESNSLKLVPTPDITLEKYEDFQKAPERYLKDEYFVRGSKYGKAEFKLPYTVSLLKVFLNLNFRALFGADSGYLDFYDPSHKSNALPLMAKIIEEAALLVKTEAKAFWVVVIPSCLDLKYKQESGEWGYQSLLDILDQKHMPVINTGEDFYREMIEHNRSGCDFCGRCQEHFSPEGNQLLAEVLYKKLKREGQLRLEGVSD